VLVVVVAEGWDGGGGGGGSGHRRRMGSARQVLVVVGAKGWRSCRGGGKKVIATDGPAGSRSSSRLGRGGGRVVALLQLAGTTYRPCGGLSVWCFKLHFFVTSSEE